MEDKKEKLPSTRIQWDIRIFRKVNLNHWKYWIFDVEIFTYLVKKKHSIYGPYYQDKNNNYKINKNKAVKEINNFNNQILHDKNWGNVNSPYKVGRTNFSNSIKKSDGINMRTRRKI